VSQGDANKGATAKAPQRHMKMRAAPAKNRLARLHASPPSLLSHCSVPCAQQAPVFWQDFVRVYPCASVASLLLQLSARSAVSARDGFWRFGVLAVKPFANRIALGGHQIQVRLKLNHREHREHRGTTKTRNASYPWDSAKTTAHRLRN